MGERCGHCKAAVIAVQRGSRSLALMRFFQLQQQGYLPSMCESATGEFTVCYDAAHCQLAERPGEAAAFKEGASTTRSARSSAFINATAINI